MLNDKIQAMFKQASSNSFALSVKMCIINELMSKKNLYSIEKEYSNIQRQI